MTKKGRSSNVLSQLTALKKMRRGWWEFAEVIRDVETQKLWIGQFDSRSEWQRQAAQASGYTIEILRRMVQIRNFIALSTSKEEVPSPADKSISMYSLEIINRLYDISPKKAIDLYADLLAGKVTLRKLRSAYDEEIEKTINYVDHHRSFRRMQQVFVDSAHQLVSKNLEMFTEEMDVTYLENPPMWRYINPDAIIFKLDGNNIEFADGFLYLYVAEKSFPRNMQNILERVTFRANFFRKLWIVMQHYSDFKSIQKLIEDLSTLHRTSVGIATIKDFQDYPEETKSIQLHVIPSGGPLPDLQELYRKVLMGHLSESSKKAN